jgi:hypothetical protein
MEGTLLPGVHYAELRDDYTDLTDTLHYYDHHVDEARAIIRNAQAYVRQFQNPDLERHLSHLVLEQYFRHTGQSR